MSMEQTKARAIPATRRVIIEDASHMPSEYSSTPGGTIFSTTPGGTRIIYDRKFLMQCKTSPLACTPPSDLPDIPGVTSPLSAKSTKHKAHHHHPKKTHHHHHHHDHSPPAEQDAGEDALFDMDV